MNDLRKSKNQLITELSSLRRRVTELEESNTTNQITDNMPIEQKELFDKAFMSMDSAVFYLSSEKPPTILGSNPAAKKIFGYEKEEMVGKTTEFLHVNKEALAEFSNILYPAIERQGYLSSFEFRMRKKSGEVFSTEHAVLPFQDTEGKRTSWISVVNDITERKQAEKALQEGEEKYRSIITNIPDVTWTTDYRGRTNFISPNIEKIYGYTPQEIYMGGESIWLGRIHPEDFENVEKAFQELFEKGTMFDVEYRIERKDGKWIWFHDRAIAIHEKDGVKYADGICSEITERKQAEYRHELNMAIQNTINQSTVWKDSIEKVLNMIKEFTGFEAVAIRLREGEDFPYYVTQGFPPHFVEAERYLCARDSKGEITRDLEGNPYVECMCGNIICGRIDASKDFFTTGGSFWSNNTSNLLAETSDEDRQTRTRNRCNSEGYKSVALIPLKAGNDVLGLIQLNDTRINQFTEDLIQFMEIIGTNIGAAFARKQAEEKILQQGQFLNNVISSLTHPFLVINCKDYTLAMTNSAVWDGPLPENTTCHSLSHHENKPCSGDQHPCPIKIVMETKQPATVEHIHYDVNMNPTNVEVNAYPILNAEGEVIQVIEYSMDITERKRAEEALLKSEAGLKKAQELAHVGNWEWNFVSGSFVLSDEMCRIYGVDNKYKFTDVQTMLDTVIHPDDKEQVDRSVEELSKSGIGGTIIYRIRRPDGEVRWIEGASPQTKYSDDGSTLLTIIGTVQDITEQRQIQNDLEHQTQELGERVKELTCLYDISNLSGREDINLEQLLQGIVQIIPSGWHYPEITCARLIVDDQEFNSRPFQSTKWKQTSDVIVYGEKTGTLEVHYIEERQEMDDGPFFHEERRLLNAIAERTGRIIERKRVEEEKLRERYEEEKGLRKQLEVEIQRRTEFTRALAHELKTPLTSVLASSEMLVTELRDEPVLRLARNISRSAVNLNSRVDELLDLARGEIGMLELKREPIDLSQLLRDIADEVSSSVSKQGHTISVNVPASIPIVQADPMRLTQIISNLVNNSVKFTPEGGKLILKCREDNGSVIVEVRDNGPGIPKDQQERMFEPYHRLASDRDHLSGLGLGLALCKTLVELHGGQIQVKSKPGYGSTFSFSLPCQDAGREETKSEQKSNLWKVLVIEDDLEISESISAAMSIRWPEANVISTHLGEKGIETVEAENPDIVILDVGLPDINGFEVLRQIRLFSSIPIIMLTVRADESDIVKALDWGADDYITKPFKQLELISRAKVQLRKHIHPDDDSPIICGSLLYNPSTLQLKYGDRDIDLTMIEGQIISQLMRNAGQVVTYSRLAEEIWGDDYSGALDSLRVYIKRLRNKLGDDSRHPWLILNKTGIGYLIVKPT